MKHILPKLIFVGLLMFPWNTFSQPNIIFILTDDQRWDALGVAGNEIIQTPNLNQLAREGTYFTNAFVTTPICAASRASILTGYYERSHGYTFRTAPLKTDLVQISYPELLRKNGYRTGFFGKLGIEFQDRLDTLIFDELYTTGTDGYFRLTGDGWREHIHLTDYTTDRALEFIDRQPSNQPFCLSISYNAAHADDAHPQQYFWPDRNDHLYRNLSIPLPQLMAPEHLHALPPFLKDKDYMGRIRFHWRFDTPEKYQEKVKGYYRMVTTIDDNIGRLRALLKKKNLDRNTVIIFMSDNGYFLGERMLAGKWLLYDNSIRVPLIVYHPLMESHKVHEMVLNIDISPTILELAGIAIPSEVQGTSLLGLMQGSVINWRQEFFCEHLYDLKYIPRSEGIRTTEWKYIRYLDHPGYEELYHLQEDTLEINNLVKDSQYQGVLDGLRKRIKEREK